MLRVGVIRGGTDENYESSLALGAHLLRALPRDKFTPVDIYIDKEGNWHAAGRPVLPEALSEITDALWDMRPHVFATDKKSAKDELATHGIRTPRGIYVESWGEDSGEDIDDRDGQSLRAKTVAVVVARTAHDFAPPWIVQPIVRSHGAKVLRAKTRDELMDILFDMFDLRIPVLIEEEVFGRSASVICVPGFRGSPAYTFLPQGIARGRDTSLSQSLQKTAQAVHSKLSLGKYSRIEMVVDKKGRMHVTGIQTVPSLAPDSELLTALDAVGATFAELSEHMVFQSKKGLD